MNTGSRVDLLLDMRDCGRTSAVISYELPVVWICSTFESSSWFPYRRSPDKCFCHSPSQCVHPEVVFSKLFVYSIFKGIMGDGRGQSHLCTEESFLQRGENTSGFIEGQRRRGQKISIEEHRRGAERKSRVEER